MGCATLSPSTSWSCGDGASPGCAQPYDPVAAAIAASTNALRVAKQIFMAVLPGRERTRSSVHSRPECRLVDVRDAVADAVRRCRSLPRPRHRTRRILTPRTPSRYEENRPKSHFGRRTEVRRSASSPFAVVPPDKCRMHIKNGARVSARDTPHDMRSCGALACAVRDEDPAARLFLDTRIFTHARRQNKARARTTLYVSRALVLARSNRSGTADELRA